MGQKVCPIGMRVGIIKTWDSRWYAEKKEYVKWLHQDINIRNVLMKELKNANVSKIEIERTKKEIVIFIKTFRVGLVLGQEGKNIIKLIKLVHITICDRKIEIKINVIEIKNPNIDAQLVANNIAEQIINRASFRSVQKLAIKKAMKSGAQGIKTSVSGRLGGVDMARKEGYTEGIVPLTTLRSNIDYAFAEALTTYGQIGIKVWICKGEILDKNVFLKDNEKINFEKRNFNSLNKNSNNKLKSNYFIKEIK